MIAAPLILKELIGLMARINLRLLCLLGLRYLECLHFSPTSEQLGDMVSNDDLKKWDWLQTSLLIVWGVS